MIQPSPETRLGCAEPFKQSAHYTILTLALPPQPYHSTVPAVRHHTQVSPQLMFFIIAIIVLAHVSPLTVDVSPVSFVGEVALTSLWRPPNWLSVSREGVQTELVFLNLCVLVCLTMETDWGSTLLFVLPRVLSGVRELVVGRLASRRVRFVCLCVCVLSTFFDSLYRL